MVEYLVPGEEPHGIGPRPRLKERLGRCRQRLRIPPQVDGIVQHRFALRLALQEADQGAGFDAVRVDREEALEAARAQETHRLQQAVAVQRGLAPVELDIAVLGHGGEGALEHARGVGGVPPLRGAKHRAPGAGAVAEVAVVEVELAEHAILRVEGLDTLVEGDGPQLRVAMRVVQAPIVSVVDDRILGDGLQRLTRVLGHELEHAVPVLGGGVGLARKVFGVHAEEA